ncbi:MAG: glycoside hydrolase family 32 protein [Flavobacteriaceae bacterium]|nr:glycoside hydrolase family 32 protein [Flavobacteriaceae bacterium]
MIRSMFLLTFSGLLLYSCTEKKEIKKLDKALEVNERISYNESYRPQYHFSPTEKWMNDPNGLVYHKGVYHLFYQHYPEDIVWGPMHWGHAISNDLISWGHKPIALYPDKHGLIFSGSAVVDKKNSSGFGSLENPPMVAIFTYHLMEGEKAGRTDFQTQGIAYSLDNGNTWKKYENNPVIGNPGIKDFRDPKVFWHEESNQWIMALVAGDHVKFYNSENLKEWNYLSDFGKGKGAHGGVWECPDLFTLKSENSDDEKWVLLVSINPGAPNGGSGTQYFIGDFDGKTFRVEHDDVKWLDYGMDNYAGITYNNEPNNDRVFIGWMSNWNYARNTPTEVWRSAMTLPRKLTLTKEGSDYYVKGNPIEAIGQLIEKSEDNEIMRVANESKWILEKDFLNESKISFTADSLHHIEIQLTNNSNDALLLGIDPEKNVAYIDRTKCGKTGFEKSFAAARHVMPLKIRDSEISIEIYLDRSSVEFFINNGRYVMTNQIFPNEPLTSISVSGDQKQGIRNFKIEQIKSIWNEK